MNQNQLFLNNFFNQNDNESDNDVDDDDVDGDDDDDGDDYNYAVVAAAAAANEDNDNDEVIVNLNSHSIRRKFELAVLGIFSTFDNAIEVEDIPIELSSVEQIEQNKAGFLLGNLFSAL